MGNFWTMQRTGHGLLAISVCLIVIEIFKWLWAAQPQALRPKGAKHV